MGLIDADALRITVTGGRMNGKVEFTKAIEEMIKHAPTVDAVPVEFIKGRLKDLRKMLMDIDKDDVDEIWVLRTKIETLTELLEMWAERKEYEFD